MLSACLQNASASLASLATRIRRHRDLLAATLAPLPPTLFALAEVPRQATVLGPAEALAVLTLFALLAYASHLLTLMVAVETIGLGRGLRLGLAIWLGFGLLAVALFRFACAPCGALP